MKIALALIVMVVCAPVIANEEGWFGFSQRVEVGWLLNVQSAVVNHVDKASPAEKAGISVGDAIISIDGCDIPGCGAYKAQGLMEKPVGQPLHLKLRKPDGQVYSATLIPIRSPQREQ